MQTKSTKVCLSLLSILFFIGVGCKSDKDEDALYAKYYNLEKYGWKSRVNRQEIGKLEYSAVEVPIQYYLLKDKGSANLNEIERLYEENKRERIVEFSFSDDEGKDLLTSGQSKFGFEDSVKHLAFGIQEDFYVVTSASDTVRCAGVSYERTYKIAPYQRVLLFFSGIDPQEKLRLVYNDRLFGNGTIKFSFEDKLKIIKP